MNFLTGLSVTHTCIIYTRRRWKCEKGEVWNAASIALWYIHQKYGGTKASTDRRNTKEET